MTRRERGREGRRETETDRQTDETAPGPRAGGVGGRGGGGGSETERGGGGDEQRQILRVRQTLTQTPDRRLSDSETEDYRLHTDKRRRRY